MMRKYVSRSHAKMMFGEKKALFNEDVVSRLLVYKSKRAHYSHNKMTAKKTIRADCSFRLKSNYSPFWLSFILLYLIFYHKLKMNGKA